MGQGEGGRYEVATHFATELSMTGWALQVELALTASRKCHFSLHFGTSKNETVCAAPLFKTGTFNHSVTHPELSIQGLAQSPSELTRPDRGFS